MKRTVRNKTGFSLMELLAVMSIMALLTTLAVTSYFAAVTGMARRSAVKNVVSTLILARQRACMEGLRVNVMFFNEFHGYEKDEEGNQTTTKTYLPSYVVCRQLGKLSAILGSKLLDEFTELDKIFGTTDLGSSYKGELRIYNLTAGGWWDVKPWALTNGLEVDAASPYLNAVTQTDTNTYENISRYGLQVVDDKTGGSEIGDIYGVAAAPMGGLPKGFVFKGLTDENSQPISVCFLPDGSLDEKKSDTSITIVETRAGKSGVENQITISSDGTVSYDEKWD